MKGADSEADELEEKVKNLEANSKLWKEKYL